MHSQAYFDAIALKSFSSSRPKTSHQRKGDSGCLKADGAPEQAKQLRLTDLPEHVLVHIFKRMDGYGVSSVCKLFKSIYQKHASSIKLSHNYNTFRDTPFAITLMRCTNLTHVDVTACDHLKPWPTRMLTQLHSLTIPEKWWPEEVPRYLRTLSVADKCHARSARWLDSLLNALARTAPGCEVHLKCIEASSCWLAWKHPRVRPITLSYCDNSVETLDDLASADLSHCNSLTVHECPHLTSIKALLASNLAQLTHMELSSLPDLQTLEGFAGAELPRLACLDIVNCSISSLQGLERAELHSLEHLRLTGAGRLGSVAALRRMRGASRLVTLHLESCLMLSSLRDLQGARLSSLASFSVSALHLSSLDGLDSCGATSLKALSVSSRAIRTLPPFSDKMYARLQDLSLSGLSITGLHSLQNARLTALTKLLVTDNRHLSTLSGLETAGLLALQSLSLYRCSRLTSLQSLEPAGLSALTSLNLRRCNVRSLKVLAAAGLSRLVELDISACNLTHLGALESMGTPQLTNLNIGANSSLTASSQGLNFLPLLRELRAPDCPRVSARIFGNGLHELVHLDLSGSRTIMSLAWFGAGALPCLKSLLLERCDNLTTLRGAEGAGWSKLKTLSLSWCSLLTSLQGLDDAGVTALQTLTLKHCRSLQSLQGLRGVAALNDVRLDFCTSLESLDELMGANVRDGLVVGCALCTGLNPLYQSTLTRRADSILTGMDLKRLGAPPAFVCCLS